MNDAATTPLGHSPRYRWFVAVKYLTFALLSLNIVLFFQEELLTASFSAASASGVTELVKLFSSTIDTTAWVLLLLLFELETAVIPDHRLVGRTKLAIHAVRLLAGMAIVSAWLGYVGEWQALQAVAPLAGSPCELVGQDWSILVRFDRFEPLTPASCGALAAPVYDLTGLEQIVATESALSGARYLALTDVINAGAWILVVIVLEVEVRLQLRGGVPGRLIPAMAAVKAGLYLTLVLAAVYWWFEGDFLDFWDAALWIFAFVFIEMNVFQWQKELEAKEPTALESRS